MNVALPRRKNWLPLVMVAGAASLLYAVNPAETHIFPPCLLHKFTGLNCPGCGATRAGHELLHGQLLRAVRDNVLLVGALALAVVWMLFPPVRRVVARISGARGVFFIIALLLAFGGWRNLPVGAWWNP